MRGRVAGAAVAACVLAGCAGDGVRPEAGLEASERSLRRNGARQAEGERPRVEGDRPVALLDGRAVVWDDLLPSLAEMSGRRALDEVVLGRVLERACAARGIEVTRAAVDAEAELLLETYIATGLAETRAEAELLVGEVQSSRSLGSVRFASMLRRNAMLRALVRDEVKVDDAALQRAWDLRYGPVYRARLIVTATRDDAARAAEEVAAGAPFGEVAAVRSTDASSARGGVVEPINPADPSWSVALRHAVARMREGEVSGPIAVEHGYAIVRIDGVDRPADAPELAAVRDRLARDERLRQERSLMDDRARSLLATADLVVLEPSLGR